MDDFGNEIYAAVAAVAPVCGVSIGKRGDRTTWRIDFLDTATDTERAAASAALAAFDEAASARTKLAKRVDADAEAVRLRYITPGNGMQMTYAEKFAQARAVQGLGKAAADAITPEDGVVRFPTLAASVGLEAATLWDCANLVLAKYTQFAALSNGIERKRLQGKKDIAAAKDAAEAKAIYEAIVWT